jgi:phosphoglycolate phosphatase
MKTFFFDLDGTLCDSRPGLVHATKAAFAALGIETETDPAEFIGMPLPAIFRTFLPDLDEIDVAYGIEKFREDYEAVGVFQSPLYPGVAEMLAGLKESGRAVWLATSKPRHYAERILRNLDVARHFDGVTGAGLDEGETKETIVAKALSDSGAAARNSLLLGDRAFDVVGALKCGIRPVGALWGYGAREELVEAGCTEFAVTVADFGARFAAKPASSA